MYVIDEVIKKLNEEKMVKVDLIKQSLKVEDERGMMEGWIANGVETKYCPKGDLIKRPDLNENVMDKLEELYEVYKFSYPSECEVKRKKNYFKALKAEEMTDAELVVGVDRYTARVTLEATLLLLSITGYLRWKEDWGSWFYQGKDKDFIILRDWVMWNDK